MMSEKRFKRALDAHITGLNNPNAPFNEPLEHPMCEQCPEEKAENCKFPCRELEDAMEKNYEARRKAEEEYEQWIREQEDETEIS